MGRIAAQYGLEVLARLPVDPQLAELCDQGRIEEFKIDWLNEAADVLTRNEKMEVIK